MDINDPFYQRQIRGQLGSQPLTPTSPNKYHAEASGGYASKLEGRRAAHLKTLEQAGEISELQDHPSVSLTEAGIGYKADFSYVENGTRFWEDTKGVITDRFRLICKLWSVYGPGPLRIVEKQGDGFRVARTIWPSRK